MAIQAAVAAAVAVLLLVLQPALAVKDASGNYTACGVTSPYAFKTWTGSLTTAHPLIFPTTEKELKLLVKSVAAVPNCRIRVVGTAGSIDGIVALKQDTDVVVVNLAKLQVNDKWDNKLDTTKLRVRMSAGKSLLDLLAFIRPLGYLPPNRSYGRYFTLGGYYMSPSTHGGTWTLDRVAKQVTGLRVLLSSGQYMDITGENHVAQWRGSLGLLGIVVALEVEVVKDTGIVQQVQQKTFTTAQWNTGNVTAFIQSTKQGASANHWFYNFYSNRITSLTAYSSADPTFNYTNTKQVYAQYKAQYPTLAQFGFPSIPPQAILAQLPPGATPDVIGGALTTNSEQAISGGWLAANQLARDGYVHDVTPLVQFNLVEVSVRCPADCVGDATIYKALSGIRSIIQQAVGFPIPGKVWFPTLMVSFRIFTAAKKPAMAIDYYTPGMYLAIEFADAKGLMPTDGGYSYVFRRVERYLKSLGAKSEPHLGKGYAYDKLESFDDPYPFQDDEILDDVFPSQTKTNFAELMKKYDPIKLFRAGSVLRLLDIGDEEFDPRSLIGEACTGSSQCQDGCCCQLFTTCSAAGMYQKCVSCDSPLL